MSPRKRINQNFCIKKNAPDKGAFLYLALRIIPKSNHLFFFFYKRQKLLKNQGISMFECASISSVVLVASFDATPATSVSPSKPNKCRKINKPSVKASMSPLPSMSARSPRVFIRERRSSESLYLVVDI